jgi:hypothetical protein
LSCGTVQAQAVAVGLGDRRVRRHWLGRRRERLNLGAIPDRPETKPGPGPFVRISAGSLPGIELFLFGGTGILIRITARSPRRTQYPISARL